MDSSPELADAAHAMNTAIRYIKRPGRFGREVRDDRVPTAERGTIMESNDAGKPSQPSGYMVDPSMVAAAIIDRLIAGRILPRP